MKIRFRKCGSCFRFNEDLRDVKAKGLKTRECSSLADIYKKPRRGVLTKCVCGEKEAPRANDYGCKWHKYRLTWNLEQCWKWSIKYKLELLFFRYIRCPIGSFRKPVSLEWDDEFDGMRDKIIPNAVPKCPHCGEMPYSYQRCVFCGQRFIQDDLAKERSKPPEIKHEDCFNCGGKNTVEYTESTLNGHKRGECINCGMKFME